MQVNGTTGEDCVVGQRIPKVWRIDSQKLRVNLRCRLFKCGLGRVVVTAQGRQLYEHVKEEGRPMSSLPHRGAIRVVWLCDTGTSSSPVEGTVVARLGTLSLQKLRGIGCGCHLHIRQKSVVSTGSPKGLCLKEITLQEIDRAANHCC
ncbi:hypothetical protein VTK56DRAFT_9692 [Thermocarpiscus australiensis]